MRNTSMVLFTVLIISLFIFCPAAAYADWNGHGGNGHDHGHDGGHGHSYVGVNFSVWPDNYYYDAPYYPYYGDQVLVSPPVYQPAVVIQPPEVVDTQEQGAAPVITAAGSASDAPGSITINIPNNNGGYTAITLKQSGNGYIGPQGEFYPQFPSVAQLRIIYGNKA